MIPIKQSLRTLARFKTYTIINLAGLVLSLSCALILMRYIHQEYTVNHFCPELERTFAVTKQHEDSKEECISAVTPNNEPNLKNLLHDAAVEKACYFTWLESAEIVYENQKYRLCAVVADSLFTEMIPYKHIVGQDRIIHAEDALISTEYAKRIFGNHDPLGKMVSIGWERDVVIRGVFDKSNNKSTFPYDMVISNKLIKSSNRITLNLVRLVSEKDAERINLAHSTPMSLDCYLRRPLFYQLRGLNSLYLNNNIILIDGMQRGNAFSLNILTIIVFLLLCVGVFNYVMLHSVVMQKRGREFGVKKVYGESRWQFFCQLFVENMLLSLLALLFVWIIVEVTQGIIHHIYAMPIVSNWKFDAFLTLTLCVGISLLTTLIPFVKTQRSGIIGLLVNVGEQRRKFFSVSLIMWSQFVITIAIVLLAGFFYNQLNYMLNYDVNYKTEDIIQCKFFTRPLYGNRDTYMKYKLDFGKKKEVITQRMNASPLFDKWACGIPPMGITHEENFKDEKGTEANLGVKGVENAYMELLEYKLKEGRLWNDTVEYYRSNEIVITESVKHYYGIEDIQTARLRPQTPLFITTQTVFDTIPWYSIIGVVEDFKIGSLAGAPQLNIFWMSDAWDRFLLAHIVPGKRVEAIAFLRDLYEELNGDGGFEYTFVEDDIAAQYSDEQRQMRIYITFALIAVFIACLGLFGLSLYDIRQRYREIAIRKINGASKGAIFRLLMRKYVYIIGSAFVVSSAVSYVAIEKYMENFYHRAPLSGWIFVVALLLISVVAFATLWWQVRNAIRLNPAEVIKME